MRFLRQRFQNLKPYHSPYLSEGVILNANESPYAVPEALIDYMKENVGQLLVNRYPDTDSSSLMEAIAKVYGVKEKNVVCGVGSDELIDCILASVLEEDDKVLIPYPSFSMYSQFTVLNSGYALKVPLKEDFSYDVLKIKEVVKEQQPKIIFICNPNNPTGCVMQKEDLREILRLAEGLVIVDEAYEDFSSQDISMVQEVNEYNNLIVLRTFSKAYALAGARVGYAIASEELINLVNTVKVPYNLNVFSQMAAVWAIKHCELFKENAGKIIAEREGLKKGLNALGLKTYDSEANFIWLELPDFCFEALNERKIYIRKMKVENQFYYRITIGSPCENTALLTALKEVLS